jgi:enamine deaminase RidA (YjgF/YER057c/UK114 family)
MKTRLLVLLFCSFLPALLSAAPPAGISLPGDAKSPIAAGVALPAGRALFWTSGTVPSPLNKEGKTIYERYGDTYTQGVSALKAIEKVLEAQGLTMKDVVYLRVYVVPDAAKDGKPDFAGWFKAYGEFFNNEKNPAKTARSTVAVAGLVSPDWLIEIEAFAAYPPAR